MHNKDIPNLFDGVDNLNTDEKLPNILEKDKVDNPQPVEKEPKKGGRLSVKDMQKNAIDIHLPDEIYFKTKLYHGINDVCNWFNVNPSLLRFWEKEFSVLKPRKNKKGDRIYTFEDIQLIELIYFLLRKKNYTIEGANLYLKQHKSGVEKQLKNIKKLEELKLFLYNLKEVLGIQN